MDASPGRGRRRLDIDVDTASLQPPTGLMPCFLATESELDAADGEMSGPVHHSHHGARKTTRPLSPKRETGTSYHRSPPTTPTLAGLSGPGSTVSGVTSPAHSYSASSLAGRDSSAVSSARSPFGGTPLPGGAGSFTGNTGPQLVMPSLAVPRRRPFSEIGKSLGKLKVLVAGQPGAGKTSLITSIAQCCEHIVHIDSSNAPTAANIAEIHASTRPFPWWKTSLDSTSSTKRRMSSTDEMLDRNLCFVDCPAPSDSARVERRYVESQMTMLLDKPLDDRDLCSLISNGTEPIVDVVLYMIHSTGPESADLKRIKDLQKITNVIPLLARADELSTETILESKKRLMQALVDEDISCFSFINPDSTIESPSIFAVSNATLPDHDNMDASVLMSSEYIQPLMPTDLDKLVARILSVDGSAWLRHSAAAKCVEWRRQRRHSGALSSALACRIQYTPPMGTTSLMQHQQGWGRIEISDWAQALRQSLATERFHPPEQDMFTLEIPLAMTKRDSKRLKLNGTMKSSIPPIDTQHQDPLGLLSLVSQIKRTGRIALELLSSFGILGCVAAWLIRPEWARYPEVRLLPGWCLMSARLIQCV